ncbi:hypothetical protein ACFOHO_03725 [Rhizorhabdus histidinilytica]|uniref:hypothetical protein n=1 Tax=Rhizorhabdus histidinilytica TaxID=439228 RepID=UPI00360D8779
MDRKPVESTCLGAGAQGNGGGLGDALLAYLQHHLAGAAVLERNGDGDVAIVVQLRGERLWARPGTHCDAGNAGRCRPGQRDRIVTSRHQARHAARRRPIALGRELQHEARPLETVEAPLAEDLRLDLALQVGRHGAGDDIASAIGARHERKLDRPRPGGQPKPGVVQIVGGVDQRRAVDRQDEARPRAA